MTRLAQGSDQHEEDLEFVAFIHRVRTLVVGLAALPIGAVLYLNHANAWLWLLLAINALLWPHIAWRLARRNTQPVDAEERNQLFDAVTAGAWVAAIRFDLLTSVLLVSLITMNHVGSGGLRWVARSVALQVASAALLGIFLPPVWPPHTETLVVVASLPLIAIFPSCLSYVSFRLSQRVRQQNRLLAQLSRTDSLTGLANRSAWLDAARNEFERHVRHPHVASLLLLDLDHFKAINDRYGHTTGDAALQALARILLANLRTLDTAGRFGGDEFGIVLPDTNVAAARDVAERICREVARIRPDGHDHTCAVSIGIAPLDASCISLKAWIEQADIALYRAKADGRNRVCCAGTTAT